MSDALEFYRTNAGLGYHQYAILLRVPYFGESDRFEYLCVDLQNCSEDDFWSSYKIGYLVKYKDDLFEESISIQFIQTELYHRCPILCLYFRKMMSLKIPLLAGVVSEDKNLLQ